MSRSRSSTESAESTPTSSGRWFRPFSSTPVDPEKSVPYRGEPLTAENYESFYVDAHAGRDFFEGRSPTSEDHKALHAGASLTDAELLAVEEVGGMNPMLLRPEGSHLRMQLAQLIAYCIPEDGEA